MGDTSRIYIVVGVDDDGNYTEEVLVVNPGQARPVSTLPTPSPDLRGILYYWASDVEAERDYYVMNAAGTAWIKAIDASAASVDSVFGRTGAVVAAASDYDASQIDNDSGVAGDKVSGALNTLLRAYRKQLVSIANRF